MKTLDSCQQLLRGLEELHNLIEYIGKGGYCCLRYGLPYIKASDIADLVYCPQKKHYDLTLGSNTSTQRMREARIVAEMVLKARKRVKTVMEKQYISIPLASVINNVALIGRPDIVIIENCKIYGVLVAKKTENHNKVYAREKLYLKTLGVIAEKSPLPSSQNMRLYLIKASGSRELVQAVKRFKRGELKTTTCTPDYCVYVYYHEPEIVHRDLARLLAYWIDSTLAPKALPSKSKCIRCPYHHICPFSAKQR